MSKCPFQAFSKKEPSPEKRPLKTAPKVSAPLMNLFPSLVHVLSDAFPAHGDVVQVLEFPYRIFCFRHPDHVRQIFTQESTRLSKLPSLLSRVQWIMGEGSFINKGGEDWKRRRRMIYRPFSEPARLNRFLDGVPPAVSKMLASWDLQQSSGGSVDISRACRELVTGIIFKGFFSEDGDVREISERTHSLVQSFIDVTPLALLTPKNIRFLKDASDLKKLVRAMIEKHRNRPEGDDVISALLNATDKAAGRQWTAEEIQEEIFSIYFGASTMGVALAWTFLMIALHPETRRRIDAEVEGLNGRTPAHGDLAVLPYTLMTFRETMRLNPPVWAYARYAAQEAEVGGYRIPKNSVLMPVSYLVHRHPDFWAHPEAFDPERFNPNNASKIHPFAYYPFGGGPRMCLGANLAPLICQLVVASVCQTYELAYRPKSVGAPKKEFAFELAPAEEVRMAVTAKASKKEARTPFAAEVS